MKRIICIFLITLLLASTLVGCQKTPESPIVVGKDNAVLIEMAQATAAPSTEQPNAVAANAEYIDLPLGQKLQIPETYTTDTSYMDGKLHLSADAAIHIPDTESMPLARVGKTDFQLSELKLLINGLYGDAPLYWNDYPGDRAQINDLAAIYRAHLAENGESCTSSQLENINKMLALYEAMLAVMPEDDLFDLWNGALSQETALSKVQEEYGNPRNSPDDDGPVYTLQLTDVQSRDWEYLGRTCFDVWGSENGYEPFINYYHRNKANPADPDDWTKRDVTIGVFKQNMDIPLDTTEYAQTFGEISITPQDAVSIASKLLEVFPNMALSAIYYADDHCDEAQVEDGGTVYVPASVEAYVLTYTQQTLHVPEIYIEGSVTEFDETKEEAFIESWGYPSLEIAVNDDGICALWWRSPTEDDAVIVQDATLLSFSEIQSIFEKMVLVVFGNSNYGTKITVNGVRMGLTRIREKNSMESGLLVPAWAFYGSVVCTLDDGSIETNTYGEGYPMLIINAVDGSIIDPYKGY